MHAGIEIGWFIAAFIGLDYLIKTWGAANTLWCTFAISTLASVSIALPSILRAIDRYDGFPTLRSLLVPEVFSVLAIIYGAAWWTVWKRKPAARGWAVIASLMYILISLFTVWSSVHRSRYIRGCSGVTLALGVTGLLAFLRRDGQLDPIKTRTGA